MMLVEVKFKDNSHILIKNVYDVCQLPDKPKEVIFHSAGDRYRHAYDVKGIETLTIKFTD